MSDSNNKDEVLEIENPETSQEEPKVEQDTTTQKPAKTPKTGLLWTFTLLNFLLVGALAGGAYWYWQQTQVQLASDKSTISMLESQMQASTEAFIKSSQAIEGTQNILSKSLENVTTEVLNNSQASEALQKRLAELSGRRPSDWLLAEADYLVNMAGRKLYLEDDVNTAKTLLSEADTRLQDLNDPALFPVRTLIAADIAALNQINNVSESSVALALSGLLQQAANLPLRTLRLPEPESQLETIPSASIDDWQENLKRTWRSIVGDFITVTPIDAPIDPYLSQRQQWLIEQQLKFALSRSQNAVLEKQPTLYSQNLQEAISLIAEHYNTDATEVDQFVGAIEQLLNTDLEKEYPDQLQAQVALKELISVRIENLFNNSGNSL